MYMVVISEIAGPVLKEEIPETEVSGNLILLSELSKLYVNHIFPHSFLSHAHITYRTVHKMNNNEGFILTGRTLPVAM